MLVGRTAERQAIEALLTAAAQARGGTLLVEGIAGSGKTALCEWAATRAGGWAIAAYVGSNWEGERALAAIGGLVSQLGGLEQLATAERTLLAALTRPAAGAGTPTSEYDVATAFLDVLTVKAQQSPVLVIVDDAHWIDELSRRVLSFSAHRTRQDRVAMVLARRTGEGGELRLPATAERLVLGPLSRDDVTELVRRRRPIAPAPSVVAALADATGGNAFAITATADALTDEQWMGVAPLPDPLPIVGSALASLSALLPASASGRAVLATAALCPHPAMLSRAAADLGLDLAELDEAAAAGAILRVGTTISFRHPLVRAAAVQAIAEPERRRIHRALAAAAAGDPERRAWHLAWSVDEPDEAIADDVAAVAAAVITRLGPVAGGPMLEWAARLTPLGPARTRRFVSAARARFAGGDMASAHALLGEAQVPEGAGSSEGTEGTEVTAASSLGGSADPAVLVEAEILRAELAYWAGDVVDYARRAERLATLAHSEPASASLAMVQLAVHCVTNGNTRGAPELSARAMAMAPRGPIQELARALHAGMLVLADRRPEGQAIADAITLEGHALADPLALTVVGRTLMDYERYDDAKRLMLAWVARARSTRALLHLPGVLCHLADLSWRLGAWWESMAASTESAQLCDEVGLLWVNAHNWGMIARMHAARGEHDQFVAAHRRAGELTEATDAANALPYVHASAGLDALVRGQAAEAHALLNRTNDALDALGGTDLVVISFALDWAESAHALGTEAAAWTTEQVVVAAKRSTSVWGQGASAFARALGAAGQEQDRLFRAALTAFERIGTPVDAARTALCWGERRGIGDPRIRAAVADACRVFERVGARPWAERATRVLGIDRPAHMSRLGLLTDHELQVAHTVGSGVTNREAAKQLFVSEKTIEYHLSNVYRKLNIERRSQLVRMMSVERA